MSDDARLLTPEQCLFSREETGFLRLEIKDEAGFDHIMLRRLFPVSRPDHYISIADKEGKEIGILENLAALDADARRLIKEDLDYYYAVPMITEVSEIKEEYGYCLWRTETDRGPRDFYVKGRVEEVKPMKNGMIFINDVHNCRYAIRDVSALSSRSRAVLDRFI
ncbi:DUF1854 domain-containing protein [Candidatus Sumerlaeota bacterium]|nr:DUF1854 domain-containing protein [Candidatus Sumerlaeota bacterium]